MALFNDSERKEIMAKMSKRMDDYNNIVGFRVSREKDTNGNDNDILYIYLYHLVNDAILDSYKIPGYENIEYKFKEEEFEYQILDSGSTKLMKWNKN